MISNIPANVGPNRSAWQRPVACRPVKNKKYADPKTGAFRHTDGDRYQDCDSHADGLPHSYFDADSSGRPAQSLAIVAGLRNLRTREKGRVQNRDAE